MSVGVAIVGCGSIGRRRAAAADAHADSRIVALVDTNPSAAAALAATHGGAILGEWRRVLDDPEVDLVVISTPNGLLAEIATAALDAGKHVLLEKPMGRNVMEAQTIAAAAARTGRLLRVGFNHRFHPALQAAHDLLKSGTLGRVLWIRSRYGHGGRPGCEREWRADPAQAGGGELLDQGVHVADLIHWFGGVPDEAFCYVQTAFWPVAPLEDNAFGLFRYDDGRVAQVHVSMTQWRNLFSFEVHAEGGSVAVEGLGGSYGVERLVVARRRQAGGVPEMNETAFPGPDESWTQEWAAVMAALGAGSGGGDADATAGLMAMRMIDSLYRSAAEGKAVRI